MHIREGIVYKAQQHDKQKDFCSVWGDKDIINTTVTRK